MRTIDCLDSSEKIKILWNYISGRINKGTRVNARRVHSETFDINLGKKNRRSPTIELYINSE